MYILNTKIMNLLMFCVTSLSVFSLVLSLVFTSIGAYDVYRAVGMFISSLTVIVVIALLWYFTMNLLLQKTYEALYELNNLFFDNSSLASVSEVTIEYLNEPGFEVTVPNGRVTVYRDPLGRPSSYRSFRKTEMVNSTMHDSTRSYIVRSGKIERTVYKDVPISFSELRYFHRIVKQEVSTFQQHARV